MHTLIIVISISGVASAEQPSPYVPAGQPDGAAPYVLVPEADRGGSRSWRESVNAQLPLTSPEYREGKRCMTVCSGWGEECLATASGADPVTRKCVRTCKSFAVECL